MWLSRMMKVRAALRGAEDRERVLDAIEVVGITHSQDVPPVGQEPGGDVPREGQLVCPSIVMWLLS